MVVVLGTDVHKGTHTVVAVDDVGRRLGEKTVRATTAGHGQLLRWARREFGAAERRWAVEDCRHLSARLERDLLAGGEHVVRVPPKLMAGARDSARTRGKSDPIDALAVARAALREPGLPVATHDSESRELRLLVDRREDLVAERVRMINRLRWHVHELDPEQDLPPRSLTQASTRGRLGAWLAGVDGLVAELSRDVLADIDRVSVEVAALDKRIAARVAVVAPALLGLPGCGPLTAAKIVGETAGVSRFATDSKFAMHAGVAPVPVWSGKTNGRVRCSRGGNRQLNVALHRVAVTQARLEGLGKVYYEKKLSEGMSKQEALRCLKRRLARTVFNLLQPNKLDQHAALPAAA